MTKKILFVAAIILSLLITACDTTEDEVIDENDVVEEEVDEEAEEVPEEEGAKKLAEDYLRNTPTFIERGGGNLQVVKAEEKEKGIEVVATFETSLAGYGPLECEVITPPKETPHEAVLIVKDEKVVEAMLNKEYDIMEKKRFVEVTKEDVDQQKAIIESERKREEEEPLEEEELRERAKGRTLRTTLGTILFEEWEVAISREEVEEEIKRVIEEGGWKRVGVENVEDFFEYQEKERGYLQQEIKQDIILRLGMNQLISKIDIDKIEVPEEEVRQTQEYIEEETGETVSFEEVEAAMFDRKLSEIIIGELERKAKKAVLVIDGTVVDPEVEDSINIDY